ncbi:MAG: hypothetical protein K0R46_1838 [Herbinix sp.]|nr:hypothetical protein [Herbinix sp.]
MNSKELLEQANERAGKLRTISSELKNVEDTIDAAQDGVISVLHCGMYTYLINILDKSKMDDISSVIKANLIMLRNEKTEELEKLLGIRKQETSFPTYQETLQLIQEREQSAKKDTDPVEEKLTEIPQEEAKKIEDKPTLNIEDVRRMYQDEGKSQTDIADYFGVSKSAVNNFIYLNHLARKKTKNDGFLDSKVEAKTKKERP